MEPNEPSHIPQQGDIIRPTNAPASQPSEVPVTAAKDYPAVHPLLGGIDVPSLQPFESKSLSETQSNHRPVASTTTSVPIPDSSVVQAEATSQPAPIAQPNSIVQPLASSIEAAGTAALASPAAPAFTAQPMPPVPDAQQFFVSDSGSGFHPVPSYGGMTGVASLRQKKPFLRHPFTWVGIVLLVVLFSGGYVFGYYIPNKPENVFKTGLNRTGLMVDRLEANSTDKAKLVAMKDINFSGTLSVSGPDGKQGGSFNTRYNDTVSDSKLTYDPGNGKQPFEAQAVTDLPKSAEFPNVYVKLSGLSTLGLDQFVPEVSQYDGKWISISSSYLGSLLPGDALQKSSSSTVTADDISALSKVVVMTTRQYIFTSDPTKAVLVNKGFIGKEKIETNLTADHYTVGIDKAHAKDYCKALITNIMDADAFKKLPGVSGNMDSQRQSTITSCQKNIDTGIKDSDTFDMWIGTDKKLINKVRFTDSKDNTTYVDIGQTYTSGSKLPLFLNGHNGKDNFDLTSNLTVDMDSFASTGSMTTNFKDDMNKPWTVKADFSLKPNKGVVTITSPKDAIPVQQVLQALGIDPSQFMDTNNKVSTTSAMNSGSTSSSMLAVASGRNEQAKDTERKTDLGELQSQLEAYYAGNGMYPAISDLNNAAWRSANMAGLDTQTLADPDGHIPTLLNEATKTQYGYASLMCSPGGGNCQSYVLTADLSTGEIYKLQSLY